MVRTIRLKRRRARTFERSFRLDASSQFARGLVGWWPMGLHPGGNVAWDGSSYRSNGAWEGTGPRWQTTERAIAVTHNGTDDRITVPNAPELIFGLNNFTLSLQFRAPAAAKSGFRGLLTKGLSPAGYWIQSNTGGQIIVGMTGSILMTSTADLYDDLWHQIVVVREGLGNGQFKLYVDGALDFTLGGPAASDATNTADLTIGDFPGLSRWFLGEMRDVRIQNGVALLAGAANQLHRDTLSGSYGDLARRRWYLPSGAAAVGNPWYYYNQQAVGA